MNPRIAIAIPSYNQSEFLFECLNSLLNQTLTDWEAVVVDDCSSEAGILDNLIQDYQDSRIRLIRHEENKGLAASRNTAFRITAAPLLLCLDSDDFLAPDFLQSTVPHLEQFGSCDCVFTDFQLIGLSNSAWKFTVKTVEELAEEQWLPGAGTVMRRSIWERAGGYCEARQLCAGNEDWDFWIGAAQNGIRAAHVARTLYFYRRHHTSMSVTSLAKEDMNTREFIMTRHPDYFKVGDRAQRFRVAALTHSLKGSQRRGGLLASLHLYAKILRLKPSTLIESSLRLIKWAGRLPVNWIRRLHRAIHPYSFIPGAVKLESDAQPPSWEQDAYRIHEKYGFLSHDFPVIDGVIRSHNINSVLEIGCGTGRLFPAYLKRRLNPIFGNDISTRAIELCRHRFHPQSQIALHAGEICSVPWDRNVDLVIASRTLQHILSEADLKQTLAFLATRTTYFYINELTIEQEMLIRDSRVKSRDYTSLFAEIGFREIEKGVIVSENGTAQHWMLFSRALT